MVMTVLNDIFPLCATVRSFSYILKATMVPANNKAVRVRRTACSRNSLHVCLLGSKVLESKASVYVTSAKPVNDQLGQWLLSPVLSRVRWPLSLGEPESDT